MSEYDLANKLWEFMTYQEEKDYYAEILQRVYLDPRYYLDHLDDLRVFRVSFLYYKPEEFDEIELEPGLDA